LAYAPQLNKPDPADSREGIRNDIQQLNSDWSNRQSQTIEIVVNQ